MLRATRYRICSKKKKAFLDLPVELFKHVIHDVVKIVGVAKSAELRLVCKTFEAIVSEEIDGTLSRFSLIQFLGNPKYSNLLCTKGGEILRKKVLRPRHEEPPVIDFLTHMLEVTINLKGPVSEPSRSQFAANICQAMMGLEPRALR
ncbi:hypothetical protein CC86DRAFT_405340 [Ophiobolus disseminans]|uniref:F-box domain-containing protein n=1 Tax=Ophiobolus disseminans TaxID=1469910 RepID=A0A6A7A2Y5_9PLEO|nr:hypothetical protein CC86DRAFT_405340 [Ophiobolus disseminans]